MRNSGAKPLPQEHHTNITPRSAKRESPNALEIIPKLACHPFGSQPIAENPSESLRKPSQSSPKPSQITPKHNSLTTSGTNATLQIGSSYCTHTHLKSIIEYPYETIELPQSIELRLLDWMHLCRTVFMHACMFT